MAVTNKIIKFEDFMGKLQPEQRTALEDLLFEECLHLAARDENIYVWLNVNDIFYYAADAEDIEVTALPLLAQLYELYGWHGLVAWVAKKRDMEPLKTKFNITENYIKALEFLDSK